MKRGIDKRWGGCCLLLSWLLAAVACTGEIEWPNGKPTDEPLQLTSIVPTMAGTSTTKADAQAAQKPDEIYVGRKQFVRDDEVFFTKIQRTAQPLEQFSYANETWKLADSWTHLPAIEGEKAKKIYWSDGQNAHTFVGYGLPQQQTEGKTFDWERITANGDIFYGSIDKQGETGKLEFTEKLLQEEDLVLAHSEDLIPEKTTGIANVPFYHALAQVRVVVDLVGFSASEEAWDNGTRVSEMVLKQMPMGYRWLQATRAVEDVVADDEGAHNLRDVQLWTPFEEGVNTGMSRQFHFYGLAVPGERTKLPFRFKVRYPDPTKNDKTTMKEEHYQTTATITFIGGKCTTIKISLNHESEDMTVSAIYVDWGYADMPDQIALHKKSTFLQTTDFTTVTTHKETHSEESDYTWLHTTAKDEVVDDKGNDGSSEAKAYCITSTQQLLSFAKEVNEVGYDFKDKHVRLDASLTLQPTAAGAATMSWMGIGTEANPFRGTLHGGGRTVSRLNGAPLFGGLSAEARVEHLTLKDAVGVNGRGLLAHSNSGAIVACRVQNGVALQGTGAVGSLVGTNTGTIVACSHDGDTRAENATTVGGLVGANNGGKIIASFQAGAVTGGTQRYGVAPDGGTLTGCYYNSTLATDVTAVANVEGKATDYMLHPNAADGTGFAADLNRALQDAAPSEQYEYVDRASSYPIVQAKSGSATTP